MFATTYDKKLFKSIDNAETWDSIGTGFNLIPFNPFPDSGYKRSRPDAIRRFRDILMQAGLIVTTRKTRGDDIDAACGQLAGKVQDKTKRVVRKIIEVASQ